MYRKFFVTVLAFLSLLRSGQFFRVRGERFPAHFVLHEFEQGDVGGAHVPRGFNQRPAAGAAGGVELPDAPRDQVNQNVGVANFLQ